MLVVANIAAPSSPSSPGADRPKTWRTNRSICNSSLPPCKPASPKPKPWSSKAERARNEGDRFLTEYTTDRRTTFSTILAELDRLTHDAGIQPRPVSYELEQVEGSDTLFQMDISAAYEGTYSGLTKFINLLDKSPRFLIIESLTAAPQQSNTGDLLSVSN